jgi:hypothetical protein
MHLEQLAFNGKDSLHSPLSHVYDFNRSYLTPQNTIFISPPENKHIKGYKAVMEACGYEDIAATLEDLLRNHNNQGPIIDTTQTNQNSLLGTIGVCRMDPSYTSAIRAMGDYRSRDGIFRPEFQPDVGSNEATRALLEIDAIKLRGQQGATVLHWDHDAYIGTRYAQKKYDPRKMKRINQDIYN